MAYNPDLLKELSAAHKKLQMRMACGTRQRVKKIPRPALYIIGLAAGIYRLDKKMESYRERRPIEEGQELCH
jgi:hypothetical protein